MLFGCYVMCRPFLFSPVFSNAFAGTTFQFVIPWMFVHGFLYFIFPFFLLFTLLCAPNCTRLSTPTALTQSVASQQGQYHGHELSVVLARWLVLRHAALKKSARKMLFSDRRNVHITRGTHARG